MRHAIILVFTLILLAGCDSSDKSTNPTPPKQILPLTVGNFYVYENAVLDSAGSVIGADTVIWTVAKDTIIQNERWYIMTVNGVRDPEVSLPTTNRGDGLWVDGPSGFLLFKYPAAVNDTVFFGSDTSTVESIHDTITVPAGTFECINYKWVGSRDEDRAYQYHYFSPGVGHVKTDEYYRTTSEFVYVRYRMVLLDELIL
ncbi:MAG: hypothetical protein AB1772_10990 [Candidatus Zixiibacteriota bacterium]